VVWRFTMFSPDNSPLHNKPRIERIKRILIR
jgi:hypothetical protein